MRRRLGLIGFVGACAVGVLLPAPHVSAGEKSNCNDFFGTGRASFAWVVGSPGVFSWNAINNGGPGVLSVDFGTPATDFLTYGCWDANSIADVGVWRRGTPSSIFYYRPSQSGGLVAFPFGIQTDQEWSGDLDGDGRKDFVVVRNTGSAFDWYWTESSDSSFHALRWGASNSMIPMPPADYNGDGRDDIAVVALDTNFLGPGTYWIADAHTGALVMPPQQWGLYDTDFYVTGDFVGDSRADFVVWRGFGAGTNGIWYIKENGGASAMSFIQFGIGSGATATRDVPLRADFSGDGKTDIAVFRRTDGTFYWMDSPGAGAFHAHSGLPTGTTPIILAGIGVQ
jgi:hypothetical protein